MATTATPNAATAEFEIRREVVLSATLSPQRCSKYVDPVTKRKLTPKQGREEAEKACATAVSELHATKFAEWQARQFISMAVCVLEHGKENDGAHIQYCEHTLVPGGEKEAIRDFEKRVRPFLATHGAGKIKWQLRQVHEHTDPKKLHGYVWKTHMKHAAITSMKYALLGTMFSFEYLKEAYKYWLSQAHTNEGGEASLNALRPGQRGGTHTMTRSTLLPDVEFFEYDRGLGPLRLPVGKTASLMVAEEYAQLHPMFASGTSSAGGGPDAVLQNIWLQLRKRPKLADGAGVHLVNQLLYGARYDTTNGNRSYGVPYSRKGFRYPA